MTNGFFTHDNLDAFSTARSSDVNAMGQAIEAGFDLLPTVDELKRNVRDAVTAGGTADVLTVTTGDSIASYVTGQQIFFIAAANNTGAVTINVDTIGAKPLKRMDGGVVVAGDLVTGRVYHAVYNAGISPSGGFQLLGISSAQIEAVGEEAAAAAASASAAATSASGAATSATAASGSATSAGGSASAASTSASAAATLATAAQTAETAAETAQAAAESAQSDAEAAAIAADASADAAATSAISASGSATTATTKAGEAASSAAAAASSASSASASAAAAATAETAAEAAQAAAETAQTAAQAAAASLDIPVISIGTDGFFLSNDGEELLWAQVPALSDGDKGHIVVSSSGTVWQFDTNVVSAFALTYLNDADAAATRATLGLSIGTDVQAHDADLSSIASLTGAADKGLYATGASTWALFDLTAAGRALLGDADAAAQRVTLGLVIGTNVQAFNANLTQLAGLSLVADRLPYANGTGTLTLATLTAAGRALLDDADAAAQRTTLGLAIGTNVQAFHANLTAFAGLSLVADRLIYANGTGTLTLMTFTAAGRALLDDADAAAQRLTLGLGAMAEKAKASASSIRACTGDTGITGDLLDDATAIVTLTDAATVAVDWSTFISADVALGGNRTLGNPTNVIAGSTRVIIVKAASGTRSLAFGSNYEGELPTISDVTTTKFYMLTLFAYTSSHIVVLSAVALQ